MKAKITIYRRVGKFGRVHEFPTKFRNGTCLVCGEGIARGSTVFGRAGLGVWHKIHGPDTVKIKYLDHVPRRQEESKEEIAHSSNGAVLHNLSARELGRANAAAFKAAKHFRQPVYALNVAAAKMEVSTSIARQRILDGILDGEQYEGRWFIMKSSLDKFLSIS